MSNGADGWGFEPLFTNPFQPGEDLERLQCLAQDIFVVPQPVDLGAANLPAGLADFVKATAQVQELYDLRVAADAGSSLTQKKWLDIKAVAGCYRACLPDYWKDATTAVKDEAAKTADADDRKQAENDLKKLLADEQELASRLSEWDQARRTYPYDWAKLARLQNEFHQQLTSYFFHFKQIGEKAGFTTRLGASMQMGMVFLSGLAAELGRQGAELTGKSSIYYGSASEAVAQALAANTGQNDVAKSLRSAQGKTGLSKEWVSLADVPAATSTALTKWSEAVASVEQHLDKWSEAVAAHPIDDEELLRLTRVFHLDAVHFPNDVLGADPPDSFANIPDYVRDAAGSALSLLSDEIGTRLGRLAEGAAETRANKINAVLRDGKTVRKRTKTEALAREALDGDIREFWSRARDSIEKELEKNLADGKTLRSSLTQVFQEGLGDALGAWSAEMKKVPKHDRKLLHDAAWTIRFIVRRYRNRVATILPAKNAAYREYRAKFLTALDALQVAVSNELRRAYQEGYYLF